jgi:hypothetical protein
VEENLENQNQVDKDIHQNHENTGGLGLMMRKQSSMVSVLRQRWWIYCKTRPSQITSRNPNRISQNLRRVSEIHKLSRIILPLWQESAWMSVRRGTTLLLCLNLTSFSLLSLLTQLCLTATLTNLLCPTNLFLTSLWPQFLTSLWSQFLTILWPQFLNLSQKLR